MRPEVLWAWSCGVSDTEAVQKGCLGVCFGDSVLVALPSAIVALYLFTLITYHAATRKSSIWRRGPVRPQSRVQRLCLLQVAALLVMACCLAHFAVDWSHARKAALVELLKTRPHSALATACNVAAWALSLLLVCRVQENNKDREPRGLVSYTPVILAAWSVQAACSCLTASSRILGPDFKGTPVHHAKIGVMVAEAGLQLLFLVLALLDESYLRKARLSRRVEAARMPSLACLLNVEEQLAAEAVSQSVGGVKLFSVGFGWVTPLMRRGAERQLQFTDLFVLEEDLQPSRCRSAMWTAWTKERESQDKLTAKSGRLQQASLLRTLARVTGCPYLALGGIKLVNDALNFAGPVLLNLLVKFLSEDQDRGSRGEGGVEAAGYDILGGRLEWRRIKGYVFALLLGVAALLKAVLNCQYNYLQGRIACRLRAGLTCMVFDKSLMLSSAHMADFSGGQVQTLMSVDADRVVSMVASLHELWSLPLQILVALVLLYTQVRFAFVAGVGVVLLLIPVNRWLAGRIEAASGSMMACKDARIKRMAELLRGIRQIKAATWEPSFIAKVNEARNGELQALAVRKYLDALCVYFWAATPALMSLLTFGLFVLLGHSLDASVVFTCLALFGVLIAPLNSFPWVVNGVVEAVVSVRRLQKFLSAPETKSSWGYSGPKRSKAKKRGNESFDFDPPSTPTFNTPLLQQSQRVPPARLSFGSLDTIDIPGRQAMRASASPFGSTDQLAAAIPPACCVEFQRASFSWAPGGAGGLRRVLEQEGEAEWQTPRYARGENLVLREVDIGIPQGKLTVVVGEVGSGKSSLLAAALGELTVVSGQVSVRGSVAYVPQTPWITSGSVRDNVLLGSVYEEGRYLEVLQACALDRDIQQMSQLDLTPVGDRGAALSGGQKVRVALARALYQDADIYLLDDVLSAVDAGVGRWLLQHAICGPLLADKTRILCSHSRACAEVADVVVQLQGGRVHLHTGQDMMNETSSVGSEDTTRLSNSGQWSNWGDEADSEGQPRSSSLKASMLKEDDPGPSTSASPRPGPFLGGSSGIQPARSTSLGLPEVGGSAGLVLEAGPSAAPTEEEREVGHVRWRIYRIYIGAVGPLLATVIVISLLLMQASRNGSDLWLSHWVARAMPREHLQSGGLPTPSHHSAGGFTSGFSAGLLATPLPLWHLADWWRERGIQAEAGKGEGIGGVRDLRHIHQGVAFFLSILLLFAAGNSIFTLIRAFSFAGGGLAAAEQLHARLLRSIVRAPASFFDTVPAGRILNRFSSDVATADDSLPFIANILLANAVSLLGVVIVLAYSQPLLLLLLIPLDLLYFWLQRFYQQTSREVRRLNSISRSPVYSAFCEVLEGRVTIRAAGQQHMFSRINEDALAVMQQTTIAGVAVAQWLAVRLQLVAAALVTAIGLLAVLDREGMLPRITTRSHGGMAGLVGLSLSYALPITGLLNGLLTSSAETEQEMVAVERISEYSDITPQVDSYPPAPLHPMAEASTQLQGVQEPWLAFGHVVFRGVGLRYMSQGPWALRGVDLEIQPGQTVGVVGRTGAGKSSLVSLLLRLSECSEGSIVIDGHNIREVGLRRLRRAIGLVPQTPFLFEGTIRHNLDPMEQHTDRDMIRVLKDVGLWEILCGISLSHAKEEEESPRGSLPSRGGNSAFMDIVTPPQSPRPVRTSVGSRGRPFPSARGASLASLPAGSREAYASPREWGASPRSLSGRPPIGSPRPNLPQTRALGFSLAVPGKSPEEEPKLGGSLRRTPPLPVPSPRLPRSGLSGSLRAAGVGPSAGSGPPGGQPGSLTAEVEARCSEGGNSLLEEDAQGEESAGPSSAYPRGDRLHGVRTEAGGRRNPSRLQKRSKGRGGAPTSFSRFLGLGGLASESPAVLVHAGFGMQLLSMRVGEGGLGLSQGQQQLLCLARALLRRPALICLDEATASVDPATASLMQALIQDQLAGSTVIQVAHRLEAVMECDMVVVMDQGSIVERGDPKELAGRPNTHLAALQRAQQGSGKN